jgi:NAD(P)H-hydrate epimerase
MEVISCQEMWEANSYAINTIGIPGIVLMENAALKVVNNFERLYFMFTNHRRHSTIRV